MPRQPGIVTAGATRLVALLALLLSSLVATAPVAAFPSIEAAQARPERGPAAHRLDAALPPATIAERGDPLVRDLGGGGHDGPSAAILPAAGFLLLPAESSRPGRPPTGLVRPRPAGHFFSARAPPLA